MIHEYKALLQPLFSPCVMDRALVIGPFSAVNWGLREVKSPVEVLMTWRGPTGTLSLPQDRSNTIFSYPISLAWNSSSTSLFFFLFVWDTVIKNTKSSNVVECIKFGVSGCFLMIRFSLWSWQEHYIEMLCPSQCIILGGMWYQFVPILRMLTMIIWLNWCMPDFSNVNVYFSTFAVNKILMRG